MNFDTTIDLSFPPDRERAAAVDALMRGRLADSIELVAQEAAALEPPIDLGLADMADRLRTARLLPPVVWGFYADICRAIAVDDLDAASQASRRLRLALDGPEPSRRLCNLTDRDLGEGAADLYARMIDDDAALPLEIQPVDTDVYAGVAERLPSALALLADVSPDLAAEVDIFGRQLVLATGHPGRTTFSGATTVFLWGAVLLNPAFMPTRLKLIEAVVHECAHALLTGLTGGIDATLNDPSELYTSPLRADPRPMEGIAHATFVLARMLYALDLVGRSPRLSPEERTEIAAMQAENRRYFEAGSRTVQASAQFTKEGSAIFENCFAAMHSFQ